MVEHIDPSPTILSANTPHWVQIGVWLRLNMSDAPSDGKSAGAKAVVAAADAWTKPQLLKLLKKVCTDAHTHGCVYVGV
jgi:hypothetical protein